MKLTDRIQASGASLTDLIHIVITSDTSQNSAGSSFKIPMSEYAALFSGGSGTSHWSASTGTNAIVVKYSDSLASGEYSLAEGLQTTAIGDASHAQGYLTTASGVASHAEGQETTASGAYSHAEGSYTTAFGTSSHSGGHNSKATGEYSFVHGSGSTASGTNTIVLGSNITGTTDNTTYVSKLNIVLSGTPSSSADAQGENGSVLWDNNYFYWKANNQWLRITGSTF